jgi:excisionase family DNA binding protein
MAFEVEENDLLEDGAMPIKDAVAWSGIGRSRLYVAMANGDLPFVRVGERRLIPKRGLKDFLASRLDRDPR